MYVCVNMCFLADTNYNFNFYNIMNYLKKLEGKLALVTGADQGIGLQIAIDLLESGCDVIAHYFTSDDQASQLIALAKNVGRKAWIVQADLTKEDEVISLVKKTRNLYDRLDILVNNTGGLIARHKLVEIDEEFWNKVMEINLNTTMMVTREFLPLLANAGSSSVINLASLAGRKGGHPGSLAYSTAKGAVITFTRSLSSEIAEKGIRVNCVAPGLILGTAFHEKHSTPESIEATIKQIPLHRAGTPHDISRAVLFLASEYDGFITGVTMDINGGIYCA